MRKQLFDEGMAAICGLFRRPPNAGSVAAIWPDVQNEPDQAITKAFFRLEVEFHSDALVPVVKIRDVILAEGKRIRDEDARVREEEARRAKSEEPRAMPEGHTAYSKACSEYLRAAFSGLYDREQLRKMAEDYDRKFPGKGFDAWINGSLRTTRKAA